MNWQQRLDKLLEGMITLGDILTVFMQTIIVSFGSLLLLGGLLWVEQNAVSHGVAMFEVNPQNAAIGALVLVIVNFSVKFWEVYADVSTSDKRKRYIVRKQYAFSLRLFLSDLGYWLGLGKKWQKRELPASATFAYVRKIATAAIMVLAFFGRTHEAILKISTSNNISIGWQDGLKLWAEKSTLADLVVWIGAIVFTFAAVIAAQRVTQYTAVRVVEIRKNLSKHQQPIAIRATGKPTLAFDLATELAPIKIKFGSDTRYKCPQCEKVMTRQAWQKHPCRFTEVYPQVDELDAVDLAVDMSTLQPIGKPLSTSVNGHVKDVNLEGK